MREAGLNLPIDFIGFDNFIELAANRRFWSSFGIGLVWAFGVTILQFLASLGLALLLNSNLKLAGSPAPSPSSRGRCRPWSSRSCGG